MKLMREGDHAFFVKFYRMSPALFSKLHEILQADLVREYRIREPLPSEERLAITIRCGIPTILEVKYFKTTCLLL